MQKPFDLSRINVLPSSDDHVFYTTLNATVAERINAANVTEVKDKVRNTGIKARTPFFLFFDCCVKCSTHPVLYQPSLLMHSSVFSLSFQYSSITQYPRIIISPGVPRGTISLVTGSTTLACRKINSN